MRERPSFPIPAFLSCGPAFARGFRWCPFPERLRCSRALVGSGLPPDRFLFAGYPPRKIGERRRFLSELLSIPATVILFESPHRLLSTLEILAELDPERPTVVARELTKIHEEFVRGTASQVLGEFQRRGKVLGECVVLFGPETKEIRRDEAEILATYERFLTQGLASKEAIKEAARALGLPKREVYRILHQKLREAVLKDQENS
jgi:16S rRNA (cytidine1402-2'-O)-methyltransferase